MTAPGALLVSIDWDFFPWNGYRGSVEAEGRVLPGRKLFVPAHRERVAPRPLQRRWRFVERLFRAYGLEAEREWAIRPDRGSVPWETFLLELCGRLEFDRAPLWFRDSHAHGFFAAREGRARSGVPLSILHFDAHADLGYRSPIGPAIRRERRRGRATCGSWVYHALERGLAESAHVVYPDWVGLDEWERVRCYPHVRALGRRVAAQTWSEWLAADRLTGREVAIVNVARSSAFAPPWLDDEFSRFLDRLPIAERRCLDCRPFTRVGHQDACRPRAWPALPPRSLARAPMHADLGA